MNVLRTMVVTTLVVAGGCDAAYVPPNNPAEQVKSQPSLAAPSGPWISSQPLEKDARKRLVRVLQARVVDRSDEGQALVDDWAENVLAEVLAAVDERVASGEAPFLEERQLVRSDAHRLATAALRDELILSMEERLWRDGTTDQELLENAQAIAVMSRWVPEEDPHILPPGPGEDDVVPTWVPSSLEAVGLIEQELHVFLPR